MRIKNKLSNWLKVKTLLLFTLVIAFILSSYNVMHYPPSQCGKRVVQQNDSSYKRLQQFVDSLLESITFYGDFLYQKSEIATNLESLKARLGVLTDSIRLLNEFKLSDVCTALKENKKEEQVKEMLWTTFRAIERYGKERTDIQPDIASSEIALNEVDAKIVQGQSKYAATKNTLNTLAASLTYPGKLKVKGVDYRFYVANINEDKVYIHHNPNSNKGQSIREVTERLTKQKEEALMITNGGMYTPAFTAQGLLVENSRQFTPLDTLKFATNLNFYMQPNGVFYLDSSGFYISTTDDYKLNRLLPKKTPAFATQSGPLLISNGIRNSKFKKGSTNHYIRSGVGVINSKKIVFIISDNPVNFYDFASIFEDIFGCKNALYLDGAISEMHINEKLSGFKNPKENSNAFGPVISISRKNK